MNMLPFLMATTSSAEKFNGVRDKVGCADISDDTRCMAPALLQTYATQSQELPTTRAQETSRATKLVVRASSKGVD